MSLHPDPEHVDAPFHYSGIIAELSEAMKHCFQAQDWLERAPLGTTLDDARRSERGNLVAAMTHLRNAFGAIDARHADVHYVLRMQEQKTIAQVAPEIARAIADAPVTPLPSVPPSQALPPTPDFDR